MKLRAASLAVAAAAACSQPQPKGTAPPPHVAEARSFADLGSPMVLAAAMTYPAPVAEPQPPPLSLTASDGTGLSLRSLRARAVIDGPLAFTELHLAFDNPEDRIIEGRFAITLPPGAAISRLAMKIDAGWQEAEVVERMAARRAYEDFLHRRQDPALLEKEAGNEFSARIFPIPARATKEIIVSFSHELVGDAPYQLPLRGLPEIAELDVDIRRARAGGWDTTSFARRGWLPDRDVQVPAPSAAGLVAGDLVALRLSPPVGDDIDRIGGAVVLFDTSASRAPGFAGEVARLGKLVAALAADHPGMKLTLATFDQQVSPVYSGPAASLGRAHMDAILARRPLGASNLGAALHWAAASGGHDRLIIVGDAVATAGPRGAELHAAARALGRDFRRLDVVLVGGIRDDEAATALAHGALAQDGAVIDGGEPEAAVARRLGRRTLSGITVAIPGATWVWPETLDGVQPGDQVMVYAQLGKPHTAGTPLRVRLGGPLARDLELAVQPAARPLVERAAARARIARLAVERDQLDPGKTEARERLKQEIIALSIRYRVLSEHTALLVLETEQDYQRFGIARTALADILAIGPGGVEVVHRGAPVVLALPDPPADASKELTKKGKPKVTGMADGKDFEDGDGAPAEADKAEEKPMEPAKPEPSEGTLGRLVNDPALDSSPAPGQVTARPPAAPPPPRARGERPAAGPADRDADAVMDEEDEGGPEEREMASGYAADNIEGVNRQDEEKKGPPALTGKMAAIAGKLAAGKADEALVDALSWRSAEPGDVLALAALGDTLERRGNRALAARAYGSIIDLFPSRADLRRFAAQRLERLGGGGVDLAVDSLADAVEQRPDHLTGWRQLAFARVRQGRLGEAFAALEQGLKQRYPDGRFAGGLRILAEDLAIVGAAWAAAAPARATEIDRRLAALKLRRATAPSTRFVLSWETDANDVDFHIRDARGGHAYYEDKELPSGGELYADVTNGYGPECFTIPGNASAAPYRLSLHYYSRGPMGYGMGELEIMRHDGKGGIALDSRPFIVMNDDAWVKMGDGGGPTLAR